MDKELLERLVIAIEGINETLDNIDNRLLSIDSNFDNCIYKGSTQEYAIRFSGEVDIYNG